jgi:hypothetical protein
MSMLSIWKIRWAGLDGCFARVKIVEPIVKVQSRELKSFAVQSKRCFFESQLHVVVVDICNIDEDEISAGSAV